MRGIEQSMARLLVKSRLIYPAEELHPRCQISGLPRTLGDAGIMGARPANGEVWAESILVADTPEKLVAMQAMETHCGLKQAVKDTPHRHGLAFSEAVVPDSSIFR